MAIRARLPYPPTVNHYWVLGRGRLYITPDGQAYRRRVAKLLDGVQAFSGNVQVAVFVHPPDRRKRDIDNILKCLLDSLTKAGLWADDNQVVSLLVERRQVLKGGVIEVLAEEIGDDDPAAKA
jgi:crossover junction endodeoxyribonuclease RusA